MTSKEKLQGYPLTGYQRYLELGSKGLCGVTLGSVSASAGDDYAIECVQQVGSISSQKEKT